VRTSRQKQMALIIPGARTWQIDGDHDSVWANAQDFVPALVDACLDVNRRAVDLAAGGTD
jgi:hypothetical protein